MKDAVGGHSASHSRLRGPYGRGIPVVSGAEQEIRRRIRKDGPITFREFMELALYWPQGGYYTTRSASTDYYTAPSAHPAFGALICLQLYQMWKHLDEPQPFWVVEPGCGNGLLSRDITQFSKQLPSGFGRSLRYVVLERNPWLKVNVTGTTEERLDWVAAVGLPFRDVEGVVLSNELLDALPVHRVRMERGQLQEVYVTLEEEVLAEELAPLSTPALPHRLQRVGASLQDGWEAEINLSIDDWASEISACLRRGFVITFDYGRPASDLYSADRPRGTLTTFRNHVQTDSPLRHVGYQDITSQVDFTAFELAGKKAGLDLLGRTTQRDFLLNLGWQRWFTSLRGITNDAQANANRMGMQQLVRPGGMGDFQVMVQAKRVTTIEPWGFYKSMDLDALLDPLAPPRLTPQHTDILTASYPHLAQSYEHLWPDSSPC